jgi:hypothetical protein
VTYTAYVVRLGGDGAFAHLLIPVLPLYLLLLEWGLMLAPMTRTHWARLAGVALLAGIALTPSPVADGVSVDGIVDARRAFPAERVVDLERSAAVLRDAFEGLPVRFAFYGDEVRVVYRAAIPVAIDGQRGLTERGEARSDTLDRADPRPSPADLIERRAVHFVFAGAGGPDVDLNDWIPEVVIAFDGGTYLRVVHWDPGLMRTLGQRGISVPDFLEVVDATIAELGTLDDEQVEETYEKLRRFYFAHRHDPGREATFHRRLEERIRVRDGERIIDER